MTSQPHRARRGFTASLRDALAGLRRAARRQANFRRELALAAAALALTAWLRAPATPIVLACALVLVAELLNTAIEELVDLVSPAHHELAGAAKDTAAAAVLLASVAALAIGVVTLGPPLYGRLAQLAGGQ